MAETYYLIVASLQFGPSHSCYAFSTRFKYEEDPLKITTNPIWRTGSRYLMTTKTPNCLLLDKNKEFVAFGYDAENQYAEILLDGEKDDYYFFQRFTTIHQGNKNVTDGMLIKDMTGKILPAFEVFKLAIKYLVSHLMNVLEQRGLVVEHHEVKWVLTVPSFWTEIVTDIMKLSAEWAGIKPYHLMLVPESVSACVYCQTFLLQDIDQYTQDKGDCMVVDIGGFTVDITVFNYKNDQLIQRYHTTGDDCGGRLVNKQFFEVLEEIVGESSMKFFRENYPLDYLDIEREFEDVKRQNYSETRRKVNLTIPIVVLDKLSRKHHKLDFESLVKVSNYAKNIHLLGDKMRIDVDTYRNLFKSIIDRIISLIERVFIGYKDSHNVTHIIMVGGFSECSLVQDAVKQKFLSKHIIRTKDASMEVVKASVLYGHQPCQYIRSPSHEEMSDSILTKLSQLNRDDFKDLVALGTFATYENRVYLAGPCNIGKSSLASILIGEKIPKTWLSTDGLIIHFGRNGIDLLQRKMIPLKQDGGDVLEKLLLGHPELKEHQTQIHSSKIKQYDDKEEVQNVPLSNLNKNENESAIPLEINKNPSREQHKSFSSTATSGGRPKVPPKPHLKIAKGFQKRPIYSAGLIQDSVLDKIKQGSYRMHIAPSDLVDFGGQKSFDMTHQLFIQHKGTFILMFDGRKGLCSELDEYPQGNLTAASILEHWINSVLTYCSKSDDKMPRIMFAATHGDSFSKDEKEKLSLQFQEELTKTFSSHKLHEHIFYEKVFFINATDASDPNIDKLKDVLVDIAFGQSTWGRRMPIVWVPLDLQIADMRVTGVQMITKKRILEVNKSNKEFALSERRVEDFLLVQHSIGKLLYFDEPLLRDFIVIQPTAMVNILRSFITDRMFWPKEESLSRILESLSSTGVLKKVDLFTLWSQPAFYEIMTDDKTKQYILQVLIHLDILVEPKRYTEKDTAAELFLVPCMAKETIPAYIRKNATDDKTICIAYHLRETVIPSALAFKLIGASISIWPLKVVDTRFCLYFQAAILDADGENELQIHVEGQRIVAYLINAVSKDLISPDLATTTQECLTLALRRILQFYCQCFGKQEYQLTTDLFGIEVGEVCKGEICVLPLSEANTQTHWRCKNGQTHLTKCSLNWVYDKKTKHCGPNCTGLKNETLLLKPNDHHFVQLASSMGLDDFYNFFIHLGMTTIEYDGLNFRYFSNPLDFMLMGLFEWRNKIELESTATFGKLLEALKAIKLEHYLCQVHREDHSLVEKAHSRLQELPSDHVINSLTEQTLIGDSVVHLGVELGLSIGKIKEAMFNHPRDLKGQIHALLTQWKQWSKPNSPKPTIYRLMVALKRIKASEGLTFVKSTYGVK